MFRWRDEKFRDSMLFGGETPDELTNCMYYLVDHLDPEAGYDAVRSTVARRKDEIRQAQHAEHQRYLEEEQERERARRKEAEWKEEQRREQWIQKHAPRDDDDREWSEELHRWIIRAKPC